MKPSAMCDINKDMIIIKKKIRRRWISNFIAMIFLLILGIVLLVFRPITAEIDIFFGILSIVLSLLSPLMMKKDKILNKWKSELKELESQQEQSQETPIKRFDD